MPTVDFKVLAAGQVANSLGTIYTAPEQVLVKLAVFSQTSATPQDLVVYVTKSAGTAREVARADDMAQGYRLEVSDLYLGTGDVVSAVATTSSVVDFSLFGGERVP